MQPPPNSFATQRRNARETARQVAILSVLFQELHDHGSATSHSVRLCLAELHVTLQKILFLLQDCAREGARLWMLTKSQHVAAQFRALIRAVGAVLDTLPLRGVDVSGEVKELVELVTKQARRGKLELDQNDERQTKRLRFLLDQFQRGVEPDVNVVKSVLNYLEIKTWTACDKEVKFLEEELDSSEGEVSLLSSLMGFLCYSRVVIFETVDFQSLTIEQTEARHSTETLSCVVPEDFRCPISLEIMTDPVTISTGQTYNRTSIQKWLEAGNMICPKTREELTSTELFPNTALKKLVQQFCSDNDMAIANSTSRNRTVTKTAEPGSPAAAHAMQFSSWFLSRRLVFGTEEQRTKAAYEIRLLARSNVFNRACLVEMGTVPPLLDLLAAGDKTAQENAISALMKLSKHPGGRQVVVESRGLVPILNVLKIGLSPEARHVAAATVFYLSSVKEYRKLIGENPEAIPALVEMVKEGATKKNAVVAIFGLLLRPRNHRRCLRRVRFLRLSMSWLLRIRLIL
ncbi:U-box domain-containing protein 19 [Spatholobus suberectus]|nr:U-box domain-containing protein 19 [Spatholobus suberectus]